uniref:Fibronectin type-III domain-containing protein n=1 Tax=Periophthalmus magnuspinnatus TaxID=409849 RepID=A0A3B4APG7_9GOBI
YLVDQNLIFFLFSLLCVFAAVKSCAVGCSTDYNTLLNCSCGGLDPPETLQNLATNTYTSEKRVIVSKEAPFCVMYPDIMEEIADVDTVCSSSALRAHDRTAITTNSSDWKLKNAVKPWPPFNIQVKYAKEFYTISWDTKNPKYCLVYRILIRAALEPQNSVISLESKDTLVHLGESKLRPGVYYGVEVQAKLCPTFRYTGPWSEWGSATFSTVAATNLTAQVPGINYYCKYLTQVSNSISNICCRFWQKRFQRFTFIPDPGEFFKPLYIIHDGDFKAWVKPTVTEHSFLNMDTLMDVKLDPTPLSLFKSSLGHASLGRVSISTVCGENILAHFSVNSDFPHEASCGTAELDDDPETPHVHLSNLNVHQDLDEGLSGSDYPLVDLDTIDSGFEECSSPSAAGHLLSPHQQTPLGPGAEQLCDLYHSNYVKQWRHHT